jgi:site-specific DNA-methyltransferase (adenine-specific)
MNVVNQIKMFEIESNVEVMSFNHNYQQSCEVQSSDSSEKITKNSTISCIDCMKGLSNVKSKSVDFILTDPPYNLGNFMHNRNTNLVKMRENQFAYAGWDNLDFDEWKQNMNIFFKESNRVLKKKGAMILFMSLIKLETIIELAEKNGFYYKTVGIWHKKNPMPRNMNLHFINSTEAWVYFINEGATGTFNNEGKVVHDFIETGLTSGNEKTFGKHPTQKPINILSHFIKLLSNEGDMILDPFMGSGSTGVSCEILNRKFQGMEIDESYYDIAKNRIKKGY